MSESPPPSRYVSQVSNEFWLFYKILVALILDFILVLTCMLFIRALEYAAGWLGLDENNIVQLILGMSLYIYAFVYIVLAFVFITSILADAKQKASYEWYGSKRSRHSIPVERLSSREVVRLSDMLEKLNRR